MWEAEPCWGAWCISKWPRPAAGEQFLGLLGDQIPIRRVPHSLSAVMLGLDWPKELGKKLVRRAETPDVG